MQRVFGPQLTSFVLVAVILSAIAAGSATAALKVEKESTKKETKSLVAVVGDGEGEGEGEGEGGTGSGTTTGGGAGAGAAGAGEEGPQCVETHGGYDIAVDSVHVSGVMTQNGANFPPFAWDSGTMSLQSCDDPTDEVRIGTTRSPQFGVNVIPGTYRPVYRAENTIFMPSNELVAVGPCTEISGDTEMDIPVTRVMLTGEFSMMGTPFPDTNYHSGDFLLRDVVTGGTVLLGHSYEQTYTAFLAAGTYDLIWEHTAGINVPQNRWAVIESGLQIEATETFDIDLPAALLLGDFQWNHGSLPQSEYDDGTLSLEREESGDWLPLGNTHDGSYMVLVVEGSYDVVYEVESSGAHAPRNTRAVIGQTVSAVGFQAVDIQLESHTLSGGFLLNGAPFPVSQYDDAEIFVRDVGSGALTRLGNTHDGAYQVELLEGTYEIAYSAQTHGAVVPHNGLTIVGSPFTLTGDLGKNIWVESHTVSGTVSLNGFAPPESSYHNGDLYAVDVNTGVQFFIGETQDGAFAVNLMPGTYDLRYAHAAGNLVPANHAATVVSGLVVDQDMQLELDIPVNYLAGDFLLNGAAFPGSVYDRGELTLRNSETGDSLFLGETHDGSFGTYLVQGSYDVVYRHRAGATAPLNQSAVVGCVDVLFPLY